MLQKFLRKRINSSSQAESGLDLKTYMKMVDECIDQTPERDIVMTGSKGGYVNENLYLVEKMMARTQSTVRLYVDSIDESIYGNIIARNILIDWLDVDRGRKVKLLLRKGNGFKSSSFYLWTKKYIKSEQIEVKTLELFNNYGSFAGIFDSQAIKIKVKENGREKMLGNFLDEDSARQMIGLFDKSFDSAFNPSNISLMFLRAAIKRKVAVEQNELIRNLTEKITSKIESTSKNALIVSPEY